MIYTPTPVPQDPKALPAYLQDELQRIAQCFVFPGDFVHLASQDRAPTKPRNGQVVYTSGTWNPGSGRGYYGYDNGTWKFLG